MDQLFSIEQAALRLGGISKWTVHAWLAKGKLRRTKVGSRTMIRECDLQAFLVKCNPESPATSVSPTKVPQKPATVDFGRDEGEPCPVADIVCLTDEDRDGVSHG